MITIVSMDLISLATRAINVRKGFTMNNKLLDRKMAKWHEKYSDYSSELKARIDKLVDKFEISEPFNFNDIKKLQTKSSLTGKRLLREYNGKTHEVKVLEQGYDYNNKIYKSLSSIAYEITGTRWNGKRFFGVCK